MKMARVKKIISPVTTEPTIRIALIETDPLRLVGLRALLEPIPNVEIFYGSLPEVLERSNIDIVSIASPHGHAFEQIMAHFQSARPALPIVVTGPTSDPETIYRAIAFGAKAYVNEAGPINEFIRAIHAVREGLIWAPRNVISLFIDRQASHSARTFGLGGSHFTSRERQVLSMLVEGRSNKEIAAPLGIEERTVKAHVAKLMRKVGVANRIALTVHVLSRSLVLAQQPV